eukprot:7173888-Lingulodinium_polyedra.AAC.1
MRIEEGIEEHLQSTQFGFRKSRSTTQPLYIIRRLQDNAEKTGEGLYLTFLDWEKAFDKVDQRALIKTLKRMGIHEKLVKAVASLYNNPTFKVRAEKGESTWHAQSTGIRQGCPLSPYLFIIMTSAIYADIKRRITMDILPGRPPGAPDDMLLYADDTVLISESRACANKLLREVEREAA